MLVVIVVLAGLAALLTVGVMRAMNTAKQTRIKVEVDSLDAAFKTYQARYGSYPPCNLANDAPAGPRWRALRAHVARIFPRYDLKYLQQELQTAGLDLAKPRPDQTLVFWLRGFSGDPKHPFITWDNRQIVTSSTGTTSATRLVTPDSFFQFDSARLVSLNRPGGPMKYPSYIPPGTKRNVPYVYFDPAWLKSTAPVSQWSATNAFDPVQGSFISTAGTAVPYLRDPNGIANDGDEEMINAESVQILACGLDHKFGVGTPAGNPRKLFPTGAGWDPAGGDDDNVTNFCAYARLGDGK